MNRNGRARKLSARGCLVAAVVFSVVGCGKEAEEKAPVERPVATMVVSAVGGAPVTYAGVVEAAEKVNLSFRLGGPLIELNVEEGDKVAKGQVLARIDPRDFRLVVDAAKATYENAEADFRRFSELYEREAIPATRMDQVRTAREVSRVAFRAAEAKLEDTYLRAPFAGDIGAVYVKNHTDVLPKMPALSLVNVSVLEVVVDVPEGQIATLDRSTIGKIVARLGAAPDREFELTLKDIASQANPSTRTYRAELLMGRPEGLNVLPGMTVSVTVYPQEGGQSRLIVPAKAVLAGATGEMSVWVINEHMRAQRRKVTVGSLTGTDGIEILAGLTEGERIATTGMVKLQEDMKVRLLNK